MIPLGHGRGSHAELCRHLLAFESLDEQHLQYDRRFGVAAVISVAHLLKRIAHGGIEIIVHEVELQIGILTRSSKLSKQCSFSAAFNLSSTKKRNPLIIHVFRLMPGFRSSICFQLYLSRAR